MTDNQNCESNIILKAIGVGGAGINAINALIKAGTPGVEFIAVNLSPRRLAASAATTNQTPHW